MPRATDPRPPWGGGIAKRLTEAVLARDGRVCFWCDGLASTFDHYPIARSEGGPDTLENGVAACLPCNQRRGAEMMARRALPPSPSRVW